MVETFILLFFLLTEVKDGLLIVVVQIYDEERFGAPPWSSGSVLDHRSLPPVRGHIWRLFRLSLRLIIFRGRSAHLAYLVHKSGRKTSIINQSTRKDLNYLNTNCRMYDMHFTEMEFMNQTTYLECYSNYFWCTKFTANLQSYTGDRASCDGN